MSIDDQPSAAQAPSISDAPATDADTAMTDAAAPVQQEPQLSKSHLPPSLASLIPHVPRTSKEQETYEHRKAEIMRKFSLSQIQALYEEETAKVLEMIEEDRRSNEDVRKQIDLLEKQRELERKIYWTMKGGKAKEKEAEVEIETSTKSKDETLEEDTGHKTLTESVEDVKGEEEGEVLEDGDDVKMEGGV